MTKLDIWNAALAALANDRFLSSSDSTFIEAVHCRREWDAARKHVLSAHEWGWLVEQSPYFDAAAQGDDGRTVIPRPQDAARILGVVGMDGRSLPARSANGMFHVETDGPCAIRYIPDNDEPETWPQGFCDAVAMELASRIAVPLKRDADLAKAAAQWALRALSRAIGVDSGESRASGTAGDKYARSRT